MPPLFNPPILFRTVLDSVLKFMVVALTCYGMSTFEGPMMSLKNVNAISHFTDWTIAHVHIGGLGWNGFLTFGILYYLIPKMWKVKLYSQKLANFHFWIGTLGIVFYAVPLYFAGFVQYLMLNEFTSEGFLTYPNFLETVTAIKPMYAARAFGGTLYITGVIAMLYNLRMTMKLGTFEANEEASAAPLEKIKAIKGEGWHRVIERKPIQLMIFSLIAVAIGGAIEIVPTMLIKSNIPTIASVKPYTPLELEGRDIYVSEGCYNCHSQMIRPFRAETERYGEYSKAGEFVYDHPFQWGSKRTGPDLHRIGGKYPNSWHYNHMLDPSSMSPETLMPSYPWLFENELNTYLMPNKIRAMQTLGVPYPKDYDQIAVEDMNYQAKQIADGLGKEGIEVLPNTEIIALIAYLQRLGTDIKVEEQK
jgi:cytochrome c oxidase cbb3-type subunit I/II